MRKFELTDEQMAKVENWVKEQNQIAIADQKTIFNKEDAMFAMCWEMGVPYAGPMGGSLTYSFTPTSMGVICKVKHELTGQILDLTDYSMF